ncbi:MAG: alkaline phosphatase family protein [Marinilabiliaceae bacterium]|nr:alkaline phosphatase family protein [Marinilabiliaceae bacterium]
MKKFFVFCSVLLVSCCLMAQTKEKKVLIIGIDGCKPDVLLYANTPHIDRLVKGGAYSFNAKTDPISSSGICWTGMLTGVWHEKHNVTTNSYKNPNIENYPHFFNRIKEHNDKLKTYSVVNWAPIHKIIRKGEADIVESYKPDEKVANRVAELIEKKRSDVIFVQLDDVDHAGHAHNYSLQSEQYVQSVEKADSLVGVMVSAIKRRKDVEQEDWHIIVTTDHGGSNFGHGKDIPTHTTIFYVINGPDVQKGEILEPVNVVDVAVTALSVMGLEIKEAWNLDGEVKGVNSNE